MFVPTEEPTITWNENYQLSWNDFKGPIATKTDAVATTASGITFSYAIKRSNKKAVGFKTKIFAHFYPEKSWYKPQDANAHILAHEQFHFNLTELYARKFRMRVAALKISPSINTELENIHKEINEALSAMQNQYDTETNFSRNFEQQKLWQEKIKQALKQHTSYKS
ncbi:MAG: DUF922 domain-containing protein [Oceanihabitans sp.]